MIDDGTCLSISHTSFVSIPTTTTTFTLDNVLYVLTMKKNLISISQFCAINDASVELFSSSFYVKDLRTGVIFLKGITKDEVYKWPAAQPGSSPILAFFLVKTTSSNWHHRLGHPAFSILKHVISNNQLASSSPLTKDFSCNACLSNKSHKLSFSISSLNSTQPL